MIQITLQFSSIAAAVSALARIDADAIVAGDPVPHATVSSDKSSKPAGEAPGKRNAATTAPSPRTAEAGPSPSAPSADAPAPSSAATAPAAAASSASPQVSYPDLQKAVLTLHKMDPTAAVPIAKGLGADTFKLLPEAKWAEALAQVNAAIEQRKVA
jgi:hypothetical protein